MSDPLLLQIQAAARAKDHGDPRAADQLARLITKLKRRGVNGLKRPNPPKTLKESAE